MDPTKLFDRQVSEACQKYLLRAVYFAHARAHELCEQYPKPEAQDAIGHVRRAELETILSEMPTRHLNVVANAKLNKRGTSSYRVIEIGSFALTASSVPDRYAKPRQADFRETLSNSNQKLLFEGATQRQKKSDPIYGLLLYGTSDDPRLPFFVDIAFPHPGILTYGYRIGLLERFPKVVAEFTTDILVQEEVVADQPLPTLKSKLSMEGNSA